MPIEWRDDMENAPRDRPVLTFRKDAGWFVAYFGSCDLFDFNDDEIEEMGEENYWFESWWTNLPWGAVRLEGDLAPTRWAEVRLPDSQCPPDPIAWLRDIDGTGSLHVCADGDPGAIPVYAAANPSPNTGEPE